MANMNNRLVYVIVLSALLLTSCAGPAQRGRISEKALRQQIEYHDEEARKARSVFNDRAEKYHECMANKLRNRYRKINCDFLDFVADVLFGPFEYPESHEC